MRIILNEKENKFFDTIVEDLDILDAVCLLCRYALYIGSIDINDDKSKHGVNEEEEDEGEAEKSQLRAGSKPSLQ